MKKFCFILVMLAVALALGLAFVSCDDGTTGGDNTGDDYPGPSLPGAPSGLEFSSVTDETLCLSWNTVPGAVYYRVYINIDDNFANTTYETPYTYFYFNPTVNTSCYFEVAAVNSAGEGPRSRSSTIHTIPVPW